MVVRRRVPDKPSRSTDKHEVRIRFVDRDRLDAGADDRPGEGKQRGQQQKKLLKYTSIYRRHKLFPIDTSYVLVFRLKRGSGFMPPDAVGRQLDYADNS
jgi:hypothetical protein